MNQFKNLISFELEIKENRFDYDSFAHNDYKVCIDYS